MRNKGKHYTGDCHPEVYQSSYLVQVLATEVSKLKECVGNY